MALFESYERRIDKINGVLAEYGIGSIEECRTICNDLGFDPYEIVKGIQPICFENACWAYTMGAAIAVKKGVKMNPAGFVETVYWPEECQPCAPVFGSYEEAEEWIANEASEEL